MAAFCLLPSAAAPRLAACDDSHLRRQLRWGGGCLLPPRPVEDPGGGGGSVSAWNKLNGGRHRLRSEPRRVRRRDAHRLIIQLHAVLTPARVRTTHTEELMRHLYRVSVLLWPGWCETEANWSESLFIPAGAPSGRTSMHAAAAPRVCRRLCLGAPDPRGPRSRQAAPPTPQPPRAGRDTMLSHTALFVRTSPPRSRGQQPSRAAGPERRRPALSEAAAESSPGLPGRAA